MERVKKGKEQVQQLTEPVQENARVWWKNNGGTFRMASGKIIKPGEKFQAYPDEISKAFRDTIIPLQPLKDVNIPIKVASVLYTLQPAGEEGEDLFDIVDAKGKKMNEKSLPEKIAKKLIQELQD